VTVMFAMVVLDMPVAGAVILSKPQNHLRSALTAS